MSVIGVVTTSSPGSGSTAATAAWIAAVPDAQALFASASYAPGPTRQLDTKPGMTSGVWQMRPESRGYVEARSADPREQPAINPNYLGEERDRRTIIAAIRLAREWFASPTLRRYVVAENLPGADVRSDDELVITVTIWFVAIRS